MNTDKDDIVFSKTIKAGKRIYYLDVKRNRKEEMFLAITESKKIINGEGEDLRISFEKHKIFLYKEDFEKFISGLQEIIHYIQQQQNENKTSTENNEIVSEYPLKSKSKTDEIKINIDF